MNEKEYQNEEQQATGGEAYRSVNRDYTYPNNNYQENAYRDKEYRSSAYTDPYGNVYPPRQKKTKKGFGKKLAIGAACAASFGLLAALSFYAVYSVGTSIGEKQKAAVESTVETPTVESTAPPQVAQAPAAENTTTVVTDVSQVVENAMPSVVSVTNSFVYKQQDFFGQTTESEQSASGSGIIVGENDQELLIATNYHVVEDADSLTVQFIDGTEAGAQMKGSDSGMDLAVMAVQLADLSSDTKNQITIAKLGDSESLKVGEPAIAIGNSLGYGQSVTTGVVSAVNRSIVGDADETHMPTGTGSKSVTSLIQTDAAINPGNSGGALLNIKGEVIGINSNKIGGTAIEGMGYAIPISSAKPIIEDLMTKSTKVKAADGEKAYLGISGVAVSAEAASTYGLPEGVYVAKVYEGTAAAKAGLLKGDIITKLDGSSVNSMDGLQNELEYHTAGSQVEITIQQGSPSGYVEKNLTITLGSKPAGQVQ